MAQIVCFCPSRKDFLPEANHCKLNTSLRGEIHAGFPRFNTLEVFSANRLYNKIPNIQFSSNYIRLYGINVYREDLYRNWAYFQSESSLWELDEGK